LTSHEFNPGVVGNLRWLFVRLDAESILAEALWRVREENGVDIYFTLAFGKQIRSRSRLSTLPRTDLLLTLQVLAGRGLGGRRNRAAAPVTTTDCRMDTPITDGYRPRVAREDFVG
jgi:hypothetical protein